jgi:Major royal jelly protein
MNRVAKGTLTTVAALAAAMILIRLLFGGGDRLPDRTGEPVLPADALEKVVDLDYPPGNVAVSADGRVFLTLHPDGKPPVKVVELVGGKPVPYPSEEWQHESDTLPYFQSILSIRIDRQGLLWALDYADFGRGQPRITAFDLATGKLVHHYDFPRDVAGMGSMLNDFQVSPDGTKIFIAETSPIVHRPAIIVYDVTAGKSRRVLRRHPSVRPQHYIIQAPVRDMRVYGLITLRIGVDSIALDDAGEWLYYGAVTGDTLYRVRTADLLDEALPPEDLGQRVEVYAPKTLSDGITMDTDGDVYLSDMEHSAVVLLGPDRKLTTLLKDPRLRWPDGFSFGPDGWLYLTCSSLQHVLFLPPDSVRAHAPYQVFRFRPGHGGIPGH